MPNIKLKVGTDDWKQRDISPKQLDLIIALYEHLEMSKQDVLTYATRYYPKASRQIYTALTNFSQGTASEIINWLSNIKKERSETKNVML